eukprot:COSAG05_NODE_226_length_13453_cov_12.522315_7_plen_86_part_00
MKDSLKMGEHDPVVWLIAMKVHRKILTSDRPIQVCQVQPWLAIISRLFRSTPLFVGIFLRCQTGPSARPQSPHFPFHFSDIHCVC